MATFILSSIGATMGAAYGTGAAIAGIALGSVLGNAFDGALFTKNNKISQSAKRIDSIPIQNSSYGIAINKLYGEARIAGNLIWTAGIKEHVHNHSRQVKSGKGFMSKKTTVSSTTYSYTASFAVAICEGVIDHIVKIWADSQILTSGDYNIRIYRGTEEQMPDPLIESMKGYNRTPAYRGIAYMVFENFPLANFGNRIPNFSFHVKKQATHKEAQNVESTIKSICIIPGSGEFVYETKPQYLSNVSIYNDRMIRSGKNKIINQNNYSNQTDAKLSLQQLLQTCPNLEWVAPVVGWFGDSLDIRDYKILPGVENRKRNTYPEEWRVGKFNRYNAKLITQKNNSPIYGGTVSDQAVLNYLELLRKKKLKIMFYPMLFIDMLDKPWRGNLTGRPEFVKRFFTAPNGYNQFILHYAELVKGLVDAFIIGSEMVSLTKIRDKDNSFPAVTEFVELADKVKKILGNNVKITYAADWTEYHHADGGWHHMDELWSSPNIDFIGIDAYFPLTNSSGKPSLGEISQGWFSGEGFSYVYSDNAKTKKQDIPGVYAWKNIEYWWNNYHYNPDGKRTSWKPASKKIWFTEYGFPSVDCCTNQPNVFYDSEAREGGLPIKSKGLVDFMAQRKAIKASQKAFSKMSFLERNFLWTWDARPYPYWPGFSNLWNDGYKWSRGHWVNGKFGLTELSTLLLELCAEAGLEASEIEIENIDQIVDGLLIKDEMSAVEAVNILKRAFFFDVIENGDKIKFLGRIGKEEAQIINERDLIIDKSSDFTVDKNFQFQKSSQVSLLYYNKDADFQVGITTSSLFAESERAASHTIKIDLVLNKETAVKIANNMLSEANAKSISYHFRLPAKYLYLQAGDKIRLEYNPQKLIDLKIDSLYINTDYSVSICASSYLKDVYFEYTYSENINYSKKTKILPDYNHQIIELYDHEANIYRFYIALWSSNTGFQPVSLYISGEEEYEFVDVVQQEASVGYLVAELKDTQIAIIDNSAKLVVSMTHGKLYSISYEELLQGKNLAYIGGEIIQFQFAKFLGKSLYQLSNIIRGQKGSQHFVSNHLAGERIIFLDGAVKELEIASLKKGKLYNYKIAMEGEHLDDLPEFSYRYKAYTNMNLPPVNLEYQVKNEGLKMSWVNQNSGYDFWDDDVVENNFEIKSLVEIYNSEQKMEAILCNENSINIKNKLSNIKKISIASVNSRGQKGFSATLNI